MTLTNRFVRDLLQSRYKDKLEPRYEEPIHQVITKVLRGLSGKRVAMPSKDFIRSAQRPTSSHTQRDDMDTLPTTAPPDSTGTDRMITDTTSSHHGHSGVKCSIKANEGLLFCLDKSFMFVPKPATYIQMENISVITMSRVGGAISASRTFDITITLKGGAGEHQFSNINRLVFAKAVC